MRLFAMLTAASLSGAAFADTTIRYTVLFDGRPVGLEVATLRAGGRVDVEMSFRNNGRGPDIQEHSRFAPDGALVSYQVKGKSTFGAPIDESYSLKAGEARWRSLADRGEAKVTEPVAYVPVNSYFEGNAAIVSAALRQSGHRIDRKSVV